MRQAIINSLDILIWIIGIILALGGTIAGIVALSQGQLVGIGFIIGGILYAILMMGMFFIVIGIYQNTRRTAEAIERMTIR